MTAQVQYETSGPLSVCPCCGSRNGLTDAGQVACWKCGRDFGNMYWTRLATCGFTRDEWARIGDELRAAGKLPPLKTRMLCPDGIERDMVVVSGETRLPFSPPLPETRWGVWCAKQNRWACHDSTDTFVGTRAQADRWCSILTGRAPGFGWIVKPYPGEQTSPGSVPRSIGAPDDSGGSRVGGEPACSHPSRPVRADDAADGKGPAVDPYAHQRQCARCGHERCRHIDRAGVETREPCDEDGCSCLAFLSEDPYASHRLAGERRRAALVQSRPKWQSKRDEAQHYLDVIDRELDRLDRTGEVK